MHLNSGFSVFDSLVKGPRMIIVTQDEVGSMTAHSEVRFQKTGIPTCGAGHHRIPSSLWFGQGESPSNVEWIIFSSVMINYVLVFLLETVDFLSLSLFVKERNEEFHFFRLYGKLKLWLFFPAL